MTETYVMIREVSLSFLLGQPSIPSACLLEKPKPPPLVLLLIS